MFERFTDRARKVVVYAQDEARLLDHNYIGTEHVLLGLIREGEGVACKALESLGISLDVVRQRVEEIVGRGKKAPSGHIPFTPRGKRVLELSLRESIQLGHNYIGTEHILLGLIREGDGVAAQVLIGLGADQDVTRRKVLDVLESHKIRLVSTQTRRVLTSPGWLGRLDRRLAALEDRLAAIEDHLGIARPPTASAASGAESGRSDKHGDTADAVEGDAFGPDAVAGDAFGTDAVEADGEPGDDGSIQAQAP